MFYNISTVHNKNPPLLSDWSKTRGGVLTKYIKIPLNFRRLRRAGRKQGGILTEGGGILTVISTDMLTAENRSVSVSTESCVFSAYLKFIDV